MIFIYCIDSFNSTIFSISWILFADQFIVMLLLQIIVAEFASNLNKTKSRKTNTNGEERANTHTHSYEHANVNKRRERTTHQPAQSNILLLKWSQGVSNTSLNIILYGCYFFSFVGVESVSKCWKFIPSFILKTTRERKRGIKGIFIICGYFCSIWSVIG